jgi:nicotinamidase-related amidase
MTSEGIRDPVTDDLLTPQNAALVVIDYQPSQIQAVRSIDHDHQPVSWVSLAGELQRDWARVETVPDVVDVVLITRLLKTA